MSFMNNKRDTLIPLVTLLNYEEPVLKAVNRPKQELSEDTAKQEHAGSQAVGSGEQVCGKPEWQRTERLAENTRETYGGMLGSVTGHVTSRG